MARGPVPPPPRQAGWGRGRSYTQLFVSRLGHAQKIRHERITPHAVNSSPSVCAGGGGYQARHYLGFPPSCLRSTNELGVLWGRGYLVFEIGNGTHVLANGLHKFINRVILIMGGGGGR